MTKYFDSVQHRFLRAIIKKFIKNEKIQKFLLNYYGQENGIGVYQGDPLSPILFAYLSHFILEKIKPLTLHTQMYADDIILILKGNLKSVNEQLKPIYKIIKSFGLIPNDNKTLKEINLSKIKYLGIWLDKKKHLEYNSEKAKKTFNNHKYIFLNSRISNGLKLLLFKTIILSQQSYGLEIFDYSNTEF